MGNIIDVAGREFERILRWVYPGFLLLVLLQLGKPELLNERIVIGDEQLFSYLAVIVVGSFVLYTVQRYLVHEIIYFVLYCIPWPPITDGSGEPSLAGPMRRGLWRYWDAIAAFARARFGPEPNDGFSSWLMYQFAIAHALGITGWLLLLMSRISDNGSVLKELSDWSLLLAVPVLTAWAWQLCHNFAGNRLLGLSEPGLRDESQDSGQEPPARP